MIKVNISTQKHPNTYALIDEEDFEWIKLFKWSAEERSNGLYAIRRHRGKTVRMHRDIMRARAHEQVDHADGNGLNNTRANLRLCDNAKNQQNRTKRKLGKGGSKYKGVFYRKSRTPGKSGRFFSYITVNRKRYNLGTFDTDVEAAKEYDSKALFYFGDFARLNFTLEETIPVPIDGVSK